MLKRLLLTIIVLAFICQICYGITPLTRFNVQDFGAVGSGAVDDSTAINNCIASAAGGSVFFPKGTYKLSANVTVPAGISAVFSHGATLSIDNTKVFTVNGKLDAGLFQIFSGLGTAALSAGCSVWLYPQWWGAVGDGIADDTAAFTACIAAAGTTSILIIPGGYAITDNVTFGATSNVRLISPVGFTVSNTKTVTFSGRMLGDIPGLAGAGSLSYVNSKTMFRAVKALTFADPLAVNMNDGNVFTVTATANSTFNASNGIAGMEATFVITNDAGGARTITFGTNFKPSGTVVGIANKTSTIKFAYDGTNWWEVSRVVGTL